MTRKVFWCCLAAGAAVCCAFGTMAYVALHPDSALGRLALAATHPNGANSGPGGTADGAELIPPDPVPVEDPSDQPAAPAPIGSAPRLPEAVAALIPPIIIHDEEDLNGSSGADLKTGSSAAIQTQFQPLRPLTYDIDEIGRRIDAEVQIGSRAASPMMPYCTDDAGPAPTMPGCIDEDAAPAMPAAGDDGALGCETHRPAGWAWWLGFFSGPSQLALDPTAARCEEDPYYGRQYAGTPYTGPSAVPDRPARVEVKAPAFPGADESSEPPAAAPLRRPRRMQTPHPSDPESDTMEMRPSDWKPYSLEPGPF